MKWKRAVGIAWVFVLVANSGCWDSSEVNDIAIEFAWGIDKAENDKIRISAQTIIPSKFSSGNTDGSIAGKPFFVVSSDGINTLDAVQRMQTKLSRRMFRGHRRVIVIGESMARQGIKDIFDTYSRDPNLKLRTDIFIVRDGTALELLKASYPLENIPGIGVLGEYNQMGTPAEMGLLSFLLNSASEGTAPALPSIAVGMNEPSIGNQGRKEAANGNKDEGFRIDGAAILNKELKLIGFLNTEEARAMRWVGGSVERLTLSQTLPQEQGNISVDIHKARSKVRPSMQAGKLKFTVTLTGQGAILENNTYLDLSQANNVDLLEAALNRQVEETVLRTILKVQQEYGTDVFGFSETIRRDDLSLWRTVKNGWEKNFREADVTVEAKLKVRRMGVTGPSIQLNPNEIKK